MASIARNFSIGVELSETGLNTISMLLYEQRPDLFQSREEIVIDRTADRKLILYAFVLEPVAFNMFPVEESDIAKDQFFVLGKMEFTLTDQLPNGGGLGLITRIRTSIEAVLELGISGSVEEQKIKAELIAFKFKDFEATHPLLGNEALQSVDRIDVGPALANQPGDATSLSSEPAFVAILNYLIEVFLQDGLKRPVERFPIPPLNLLPGTDVNLYMRGLQVDGNTLGAYLHRVPGGPIAPSQPGPRGDVQLGIGVVEPLINEVLRKSLPVQTAIDPTPDHRTFSLRSGGWTRITKDTYVDLRSPSDIKARVSFEAHIPGQINIKLGKYSVRAPLDLPLRAPSRIEGIFVPFIEETDDQFLIKLRPSEDFFDFGHIILVTDYARIFSDAVRDFLRSVVSPVLKKIPLIGWIIAKGVEEIISELVRFFVRHTLDNLASIFLSILATLLFNTARLFFSDKLALTVYELDKKLPVTEIDLRLSGLDLPDIDPNAGGELLLNASFNGTNLPLPPAPIPSPPDQLPDIPSDQGPTLPQDPDEAFQPVFALARPAWENGTSLTYDVVANVQGETVTTRQIVTFTTLTGPDRSVLECQTLNAQGAAMSEARIVLASGGVILSETETSRLNLGESSQDLETTVYYDHLAHTVEVSSGVRGMFGESKIFQLPKGAVFVPSTLSVFMLMTDLELGQEGHLGRLDINLGTDFENWTRSLPITLRVEPDTVDIELEDETITCAVVIGTDAEVAFTAHVEIAGAHRVVKLEQRIEETMTATMALAS